MSVDLAKMQAVRGKTKKRQKRIHQDQMAFSFYAKRSEVAEFAEAEKKQQKEHKDNLGRFKGLRVDWGKISNVEIPIFNYDLKEDERSRYLSMLERGNSDKERKRLSKMLGLEFARIYTKYRRQIQASAGKNPGYQVHPRERRHARQAGELCLRHKIKPQTLLEYWHDNIVHFAGVDTKFVPLTFCASASNVETVVKRGFAKTKEDTKLQDGRGHSFADTSKLEPQIRKRIEYAGFDTTMFNDRHLLSVQRMAKNVADGRSLFIPSELRGLVDWIAENYYA